MAQKNHNEVTNSPELSALAREITNLGYRASPAGTARRPKLRVSHPEIAVRSAVISADSGVYWLPDAVRLTSSANPLGAARTLVHMLHVVCDCYL